MYHSLSLFQLEAWSVADELLQRATDMDCCYFGAQIMRNKIIFSLHELPQDKILELHSSLMQKLIDLSNKTENFIVTQVQQCIDILHIKRMDVAFI